MEPSLANLSYRCIYYDNFFSLHSKSGSSIWSTAFFCYYNFGIEKKYMHIHRQHQRSVVLQGAPPFHGGLQMWNQHILTYNFSVLDLPVGGAWGRLVETNTLKPPPLLCHCQRFNYCSIYLLPPATFYEKSITSYLKVYFCDIKTLKSI